MQDLKIDLNKNMIKKKSDLIEFYTIPIQLYGNFLAGSMCMRPSIHVSVTKCTIM